MKKMLALILALVLILALLAGCGGGGGEPAGESAGEPASTEPAPEPAPAPDEPRVLHDTYGDVTIEGDIDRVVSTAPAYTVSVLLMGGKDKLVGIDANSGSNEWLLKMFPELADVPVVTVNSEVNLETLMSVDPDLIIFTPAMKEQKEKVDELGLIVINEPVYDENETLLERNRDRQMYYGIAMGGESLEIAEAYEAYFNDMVDHVYEATAGLSDSEKPVVVEIRSLDPVVVSNGNDRSVAQDWITAAGGINAAGGNSQEGKSGAWEVSVEEVFSWDPDYIVCSQGVTPEDLMNDEQFSRLDAVIEGRVVVMPKGLMTWGYNGPELPLFVEFMGKYLHPDLFEDVDVIEDARDFYARFFGLDITDEDLQYILQTDLPLDEYARQTFGE